MSVLSEARPACSEGFTPKTVVFPPDRPLLTDGGGRIAPLAIAYETRGTLNAARSNAILLCHALTGDQYAAGVNPVTGKSGWWEAMVGPGKPFDTDRYFLICSNVVGGCMGTTGPASINPTTGKPYGVDFPVVTIRDMVRAQAMLIDHLGIETLFCVAGGSMGGMQVLQWAASYPERVFSAMPIATAAKHSAQNIAFHEVGRQAVMADPDWRSGRYQEQGVRPEKGLAVARMSAHITYLSEPALQCFGGKLQGLSAPTFSFNVAFQVETICVTRASPSSSGSMLIDRHLCLRMTSILPLIMAALIGHGLQGHEDVLLALRPLRRTGSIPPRTRGPSFTRSTPAARRCPSSKSNPTRGTTHSCCTSRCSLRRRAAFSIQPQTRAASRLTEARNDLHACGRRA